MPDSATLISVFTLVVLLLGAPRYVRGLRAKGFLEEKDRVIETKQQTIDACNERVASLETDREGARAAAKHATEAARFFEQECAQWRARYEEQSKYTAKEALQTIEALIAQHAEQVALRHREMMTLFGKLDAHLSTLADEASQSVKDLKEEARHDPESH